MDEIRIHEIKPVWHSVTCACPDCIYHDELYMGIGSFIPKERELFAKEEVLQNAA